MIQKRLVQRAYDVITGAAVKAAAVKAAAVEAAAVDAVPALLIDVSTKSSATMLRDEIEKAKLDVCIKWKTVGQQKNEVRFLVAKCFNLNVSTNELAASLRNYMATRDRDVPVWNGLTNEKLYRSLYQSLYRIREHWKHGNLVLSAHGGSLEEFMSRSSLSGNRGMNSGSKSRHVSSNNLPALPHFEV